MIFLGSVFFAALTTVRQPADAMADAALSASCRASTAIASLQRILLQELVVWRSCGPPP
jgi:DNA-binding LacI/PurR family transcriptional regulator